MSLARYLSKLAAFLGSDGKVPPAGLSTGAPTWDTSGNLTLPTQAKATVQTGSVVFDVKPNAGAADYVSLQATYAGTTKEGVNVDYLGRVSVPQGQIKFPATQNPSSDANTLDDYEEGTFTPYLTRGTSAPTISYAQQQGKYTKIGRLVTIHVLIQTNGISVAGSGSNLLGGLPFPHNSNNAAWSMIGPIAYNNVFSASNVRCVSTGTGGANFFSFHDSSVNTAEQNENYATGYLTLTVSYTTDT